MIRNMSDLCHYFGADTPARLNRRLYKDTSCGASISVKVKLGRFTVWVHNGEDSQWAKMTLDTPLLAFTIQTIVEGSDATVNSDEFRLPVRGREVDNWIDYMEDEAERLYNENGID